MSREWKFNASTDNYIHDVGSNGRIIRSGRDGRHLYRAEFWGDHSPCFPVGLNYLTFRKALAALKKMQAHHKSGCSSESWFEFLNKLAEAT